jgi:hypothetical protein
MEGGALILFAAGGGETVASKLLKLLFWAEDWAVGAANWVDEVMVDVDAGETIL